MEQLLGCINFGNTREGLALETLHEALRDKTMWMLECEKKDEEIERLKKLLEERDGSKVERSLRKPRVVRKSRKV
jgi:hypothetical protein